MLEFITLSNILKKVTGVVGGEKKEASGGAGEYT